MHRPANSNWLRTCQKFRRIRVYSIHRKTTTSQHRLTLWLWRKLVLHPIATDPDKVQCHHRRPVRRIHRNREIRPPAHQSQITIKTTAKTLTLRARVRPIEWRTKMMGRNRRISCFIWWNHSLAERTHRKLNDLHVCRCCDAIPTFSALFRIQSEAISAFSSSRWRA